METTVIDSVASQLIPIANQHILLPNVAIAEVISYDAGAVESLSHSPDWLLGLLHWRGIKVPLVSFERCRGEDMPDANAACRVVVLNTLNGKPNSSFVALLAQGLPQLLQLGAGAVSQSDETVANPAHVLSQALLNGEPALIPDIDSLEALVADYQVRSA
jgi:chemosensory pili system protein ChpC